MRRKFAVVLLILAILLLSWSAQASVTDCFISAHIANCKQYVTLRSYPSTGAAALERLYLGEDIVLISRRAFEENGKYFVYVETDREIGFVLIDYIDTDLPYNPDRYGIGYGTVAARNRNDDLILRAGPGTSYATIGYLFGGEVLPSLGMAQMDNNGRLWYCCSLDGTACWISSRYADLLRP